MIMKQKAAAQFLGCEGRGQREAAPTGDLLASTAAACGLPWGVTG
jgi:hypothetical protein